jgi:signal transduction histidine kinase
MAAPSIIISLVLLALGIGGGWYVQRLQKSTAALVALDTSTIRAAEQLVFGMNAIRSELTDYLVNGKRSHLETIPEKCSQAEHSLAEAERLVDDPDEIAVAKRIRDGFDRFRKAFRNLPKAADEKQSRAAVQRLIDVSLEREVLQPAKELLSMEEELVRKSGDYNQGLARWIAFFLFLIGVCGAVAGLVAGFGIARSISRSIIELYMPIRAASGRLEEVVGPVDVAPGTGLRVAGIENLDAILRRMADQVGIVVDRLQKNQTEMLRSEQMAALGQLAAGLAHELRNPLTAMKMLIQGAVELGPAGNLGGRDLSVLHTETVRLERSIQAFLDFARPPQLEKRCRDLREAVTQTIELVAARGRQQGITCQCDLPDRPLMIEADHEQLRQLFLNLVLNAMDVQPRGGTVQITLAESHGLGADDNAVCGEDQHAPWIVATVVDRGPGIAADIAKRIFDPYVSTKETGLGLGLAICRRIVQDHGGEISANNDAAGGAVFTVRLPVFRNIPRDAQQLCLPC